MSIFDRSRTNSLRDHGYAVFEPSYTQDETIADYLRERGWHIAEPGRYSDLATILRTIGYTVHPSSQSAQHELRAAGWRLFPPYAAPEAGSVWEPMRGKTLTREVIAVLGDVTYRADDGKHTVTLATWDRWVRRAGAVKKGAEAP